MAGYDRAPTNVPETSAPELIGDLRSAGVPGRDVRDVCACDGVVQRTVFPEIPPRVEYQLTPLGQTLIGPVAALADWAVAHNEVITANQNEYDAIRNARDRITEAPSPVTRA